ncbi:conserved membrane hypothetical protein [Capnocytophaga canimorsus]|uniref:Uncharacterized protein n=2 Tax=Capnocytophaga canimorsus TaxID=28188 RepID=A0A0B7HM09_9FLAO|nr:hypothetical protein [Capnocytophaga canimorsus]ATA76745.1 hypothetical protein CGC47_03675 [Capnocytophaga canimorsus]PJI84136.1 hypothetical protein CLV61_0756 [Capnocytophaga canimorsus]CEN40771.1 conserved membrane hypothetical protein [Capnocytophaga canimorsus]STA71937.1 Uncharacterised protein [Capnocytophaga canimorsus]
MNEFLLLEKMKKIILGIVILVVFLSYGQELAVTHQETNWLSGIFDFFLKIKNGLMLLLFSICAAFLYVLGWFLGLNYKEISVYFNLYFQTIVPIVIGVYFVGKYFINKRLNVFSLLTIVMLVGNIYLLLWVYKRYPIVKINYSFNKCVADLQWLAKYFKTQYVDVNIYIFVVGFILNIALYLLFYRLSNYLKK